MIRMRNTDPENAFLLLLIDQKTNHFVCKKVETRLAKRKKTETVATFNIKLINFGRKSFGDKKKNK